MITRLMANRRCQPKRVQAACEHAFVTFRGRVCRLSAIFLLMLFATLAPQVVHAQGSANEYDLKAAMLYNMLQFVDWPTSAYPDRSAPDLLCVLGWDPFGSSLSSLVSRKVLNGRPTELRHFRTSDGAQVCHVLYISSSERKSLAQILSSLKGTSVLTVGEMSQFAAHGGMIQFALEDKQVHFEINLDAATRAELKISSRLLVLATIVKDESTDPHKNGATLPLPASPGDAQYNLVGLPRGSPSPLDFLAASAAARHLRRPCACESSSLPP